MQCNHLAPHAQGACCGQSNDVSNTCGSTKHGWDDCFRDSNSNALQTQGGEPQVTDNKQEGSSHSFGETADTQACADGQASQRCQHGPIDKLYQNSTWTVLPRDPTGAVMPVDSAGLSISTSSSSADDTTADADSAAPSNSVFFARVPPTVPYEAIHALFAQFGTVLNLNLFRPWASAKTSKGCGIVEYDDDDAAVAAMDSLHQKYHWTGGETTMVVEWMDPRRHRKERQGDGSAQSKTAARNIKNNRPKNGKHNPFNIAMALPGMASRIPPPIRTTPLQRFPSGAVPGMGLAYSNASQQAAVMMGLGVEGFARRGSCPGSFGLSGGFSAHPLLADGCTGQLDAALLEQLGYGATANMQLGGVPTQWGAATPNLNGTTGAPPAFNAATWPLQHQAFASQVNTLGSMPIQMGLQDTVTPNMAAMLLQRQRRAQGWSAMMPGLAGMQGDVAFNTGSFASNELNLQQMMLANLNAGNAPYAGLNGLDAGQLGGLADGVGNAATEAAANMQYLANLQYRLDALGTCSSMSAPNNSLQYSMDSSNSESPFTPSAATTAANAAAASWLLANGSGHNAQLPPIATLRRSLANDGIMSMNNSPMTGATPTTFQQQLVPSHNLSNLNPGGAPANVLASRLMSGSGTHPSGLLTDQQLAGITAGMNGGGFGAGGQVGASMMAGHVPGRSASGLVHSACEAAAGGAFNQLLAAADAGHVWPSM